MKLLQDFVSQLEAEDWMELRDLLSALDDINLVSPDVKLSRIKKALENEIRRSPRSAIDNFQAMAHIGEIFHTLAYYRVFIDKIYMGLSGVDEISLTNKD